MLGKLLKYEYKNRGRVILGVLVLLLVYSLLTLMFAALGDNFGGALGWVFDFFKVVYPILLATVFVIALIYYPIDDFRKRLFKEQGYLTNTLPVPISKILLAKILFDCISAIVVGLTMQLSLSIVNKDFSWLNINIESIKEAIDIEGASNFEVVLIFIFIILYFLTAYILGIWTINTAYTIGHSFSKHRKAMSIVFFNVLWLTEGTLMLAIIYAIEKGSGIFLSNPGPSIIAWIIGLVNLINVIFIIANVMLSGITIKKKINLE